jgi:hypothetical protein
MISIGGAATEDSADPELIVSFGVYLVCPLPAQVCFLVLDSHPHFICRVHEDPIVERASTSEVNCEPDDRSLCPVCRPKQYGSSAPLTAASFALGGGGL